MRKWTAKEAHEIALEIQAIYDKARGDRSIAIPKLAEIVSRRRRRIDSAKALSLADSYFRIYAVVDRLNEISFENLRETFRLSSGAPR